MTADPDAPTPAQPHVELRGVGKTFGGTPALRDVDLTIERGSVHGLVGENGAGKSSLCKIIAGRLIADSGEVLVDGEPVTFRSPREALDAGIVTIAQELALVPALTVAENVFLGAEPRRAGFIRRRVLRARYRALAARTDFDVPGDAIVGSLRTADQQKVEIMRALASGASLVIMDEPTAALSGLDAERLHAVIRSLADAGTTVVLISHFLPEVLALSDTVTILRDGRLVRTAPAADETEATLIEGMLGRSMGTVFPPKSVAAADADEVLRADDVVASGVDGISLTVRAGEIVGLAGLVGAGRSELAHAIVGAARRTAGTVTLLGEPLGGARVRGSIRRGMFLIPESRRDQGLVPQRSIRENVTISDLAGVSVAGWVRRRRERSAAQNVLREVTVQGDDRRPVSALSGGNQQKVMFARAMQRPRRLLIADEPTRGVDVGSRRAIYEIIVEQAARGVAVLVISSDIEEVLGLAHRVLVVRQGRVAVELSDAEMTEHNVLLAAFGDVSATQAIEPPEASEPPEANDSPESPDSPTSPNG